MISNIFSTPIYEGKVLKTDIISEILSDVNFEEITKYTSDNTSVNHSWFCNVKTGHGEEIADQLSWHKHFIDAISPNIFEYVQSIKTEKEFNLQFSSPWVNIYNRSDFQEEHHHLGQEQALLSYAYIHKMPNNSGEFYFKNALAKNTYFSQKEVILRTSEDTYSPQAGEGDIIVFPAWLEHGVSPNRSDSARITISGNISLL